MHINVKFLPTLVLQKLLYPAGTTASRRLAGRALRELQRREHPTVAITRQPFTSKET